MRFATSLGRALVTFDTDYLAIAWDFLTTSEPFAGVVWCKAANYCKNPTLLAVELLTVHGAMTVTEMMNHVECV